MRTTLPLLILMLLTILSCEQKPLVIGIVPSETPEKLIKEFELVEKYLEKEMNRDIEVYVPEDYRELIQGMRDSEVDIGLYGPFSYIIADSQQSLVPLLVRKKRKVGVFYNSIILTAADSGINSLEELEDRKVAFVNSASTSGFIIPHSLLISRNIDKETYFSEYYFSGSHDRSILDAVSGQTDAVFVSKTILERMLSAGEVVEDDFRIIWESEPIPGSPYIARRELDNRIIEQFTASMLEIHRKAPEALNLFDDNIEKYVPIEKGMYNPIRNIINILGDEFIESNFL